MLDPRPRRNGCGEVPRDPAPGQERVRKVRVEIRKALKKHGAPGGPVEPRGAGGTDATVFGLDPGAARDPVGPQIAHPGWHMAARGGRLKRFAANRQSF